MLKNVRYDASHVDPGNPRGRDARHAAEAVASAGA